MSLSINACPTLLVAPVNNHRFDPLSLFYQDFKFDFFVLAEQTTYQYVHVRPTAKPLALAQAGPSVLTLPAACNSGVRTRHRRAWWPKLLKDKKRLVAEVRAMEERYGGRATLQLKGHRLYWEYTVVESGRHFPIHVCYPARYPLEPPRIFSLLPLPGSPHQMPGNELCWTNRLGLSEWNPARDTAVVCINAAHRWFACLLIFLTLGKWPTEADDLPVYTT